MRHSFLVAMAFASLAVPVLAHEGGVDAKGRVKAITADRIDVQTSFVSLELCDSETRGG